MKYLIRKYKISKILNQPVTGLEGEIILFIQFWLKDLIPFKMEHISDSIFYMNSAGLYVIEQNPKNKYLYVRWIGFWNVLESKYLMKYEDIQLLLKFMIEESFKQKLVDIEYTCKIEEAFRHMIEDAFKKKTETHITSTILSQISVEEAYKQQYNK